MIVRRYLASSAAISCSNSQMGTSTAIVVLSFASMKRCNLGWRSRLEPTAGMISAGVAMAGRQPAADLVEGMTLIIRGERIEDFVHRVGLVAQGARSRRETAVAGAADVEADSLQLLQAPSLGSDLLAAAMRAALRRL